MGLFTGKTVIITGGGKATLKDGSAGSIGYGIDIAFAKEGANLVITGRNVAKLEAAKESLEAEYGVKVLPVQADVSAGQDNEAVVQNVIDKAIEEFGRIDAVVNNAQASASGVTIADHTMDQFNLAIYSGLYAAYLYSRARELPGCLPRAFKANVHMPPAGHYGDVEKEIGRVVVQLCGPDFKYMNGETVTLEGGMGQRP